jgi:histidinol-phosphate aminotransferase
MNRYWNSRVSRLDPYVPGEQPKNLKLIKLNTNENPYPPSPRVIEAVKAAAGDSLRLYPDPECSVFRQAVAGKYGLGTEQVFAGNGSDEVLAFAFAALFESGDGAKPALFPDITYSFYPVYAGLWDVPYKTVPLNDDFSLDLGLYREMAAGCGGVVFPNPNAPTGRAINADGILDLARELEKQGKVLIVDEAYSDFGDCGLLSRGDAARNGGLFAAHPNVLVVHTLSKSASLAGLRAGYAIGDGGLIGALRAVRDSFNSYTMDALALAGAAAAVADAAYYDGVNAKVKTVREKTASALAALGFDVVPSQANFIFAAPPPPLTGRELFAALREKGILIRRFDKPRIDNYLRISIGTDEEMDTMTEIVKMIIKAHG